MYIELYSDIKDLSICTLLLILQDKLFRSHVWVAHADEEAFSENRGMS